ncbi:hypothetical protein ACE38V_09125 [Cytobacillus sp. Hz8]|uniref:hypothetical protein n=1 Tax=Cytobacillus sp. Hz8 TaxID=3347168 RepID=UPI0035DE5A2D
MADCGGNKEIARVLRKELVLDLPFYLHFFIILQSMMILIKGILELQERGLFRMEYSGHTLREHFGLEFPVV